MTQGLDIRLHQEHASILAGGLDISHLRGPMKVRNKISRCWLGHPAKGNKKHTVAVFSIRVRVCDDQGVQPAPEVHQAWVGVDV